MPPEIPRKVYQSCSILRLAGSPENHNADAVLQAWLVRRKSCSDYGFTADVVDSAKHVLLQWIEESPGYGGEPSGIPQKPLPSAGSGSIALSFTEPKTET